MKSILIVVALLTPPTLHATTCSNPLPANAVVTPACTWIVEQYDPGVWKDNLGQFWILVEGRSVAVKVRVEDLRIGQR